MNDWKARAEREAAAILDGALGSHLPLSRDTLLAVMALAWLQGNIAGSHETLAQSEVAFARLREDLFAGS